jgi:hypothetical protein
MAAALGNVLQHVKLYQRLFELETLQETSKIFKKIGVNF